MDKTSSTFDLHGFCLLVQHVIFSNFLSTIYIYADTVPLVLFEVKKLAYSSGAS